jgi:hypothetical protein
MWTSPRTDAYAGGVPDSSDLRRFRLDKETWEAYGELVGDGGRSADLKAYIDWRLDNPTTPLPGKRRGPVKRTRKVAMPKPKSSPQA